MAILFGPPDWRPSDHAHVFRISSPADIDPEFRRWLAEAYLVGEQKHLERRP